MVFPLLDRYWTASAEFVRAHIKPDASLMLAPAEFQEQFRGQVISYPRLSEDTARTVSWAIIHKGLLARIDRRLLDRIMERMKPVFANEVFVVYSGDPDVPEMDRGSVHLRALDAALAEPVTQPSARPEGVSRATDRARAADARAAALSELHDELAPRAASAYLGDHTAVTRTAWGHKLFVDTRDLILAPHIMLDGYWELWGTRTFLTLLREGMVVVDIGANVGYYTVLAAWKVGERGHVHAFEANSRLCDLMVRTVTVNGFLDRVTVINKAVWHASSRVLFSTSTTSAGANRIVGPTRPFPEGGAVEVDAISLDDYFGRLAQKVDVLKIDAEGAEPHIFRGMRQVLQRNREMQVVCEFNTAMITALGQDPARFLEELRSWGFAVKLIQHDGENAEVSDRELLDKGVCELLLAR